MDQATEDPSWAPEVWLGEWTHSAAPTYCRDLTGCMLAANGAFLRQFGRPIGDIRGASVTHFIHPDDVESYAQSARNFGPRQAEGAQTHRWRTRRGWRWFTWEEMLLPATSERSAVVRAVGRDITRQRLAEELYLKLSRAVDQSPIPIVITDADGRAQYVNPKYIEVSGQTLEDIIDGRIPILREGHETDAAYREFWATVSSGRKWRGELARKTPAGRMIWESVQVSCLRSPAGEITNYVCMREDITERRHLEEELRQVQKMESLGTVAGGIAHDFNNILAVINGYADIGLLRLDDPALLQKSLREIKRAVQRASGLVRQILTFSRKAEVHFGPVDLNQLVCELSGLLQETFPRTINFGLNVQDGLPPLIADHNQLQQVVLNLFVNARDAMPSGGTISVSTSGCHGRDLAHADADRTKDYARLTVNDTGIGMTPEVRARIFEPFFTTKAVNRGTGLGLAVVYGIVASHHGFIDVETAPDAGSTFHIYLPLAVSGEAAPVPVPTNDFPGGTEAVLVVDDEDPLRNLLKTALGHKGYQITCASDGLEAIDMISNPERKIDAVLLDLNMPGASGLSVLKVIESRRPDLKVLMISGNLSSEARSELDGMKNHDFLHKPYTLGELGQKLRHLLDT